MIYSNVNSTSGETIYHGFVQHISWGKWKHSTGVSLLYEPHCWLFSVPNCCITNFLASSSLF